MKNILMNRNALVLLITTLVFSQLSCTAHDLFKEVGWYKRNENYATISSIVNYNGGIAYRARKECLFENSNSVLSILTMQLFRQAILPVNSILCSYHIIVNGIVTATGKNLQGPYLFGDQIAYIGNNINHARELILGSKSIINGYSIEVKTEGEIGIITVDNQDYVIYNKQLYGPYTEINNAAILDDKLFFSVKTNSEDSDKNLFFYDGNLLGEEYQIADPHEYTIHRGEIAFTTVSNGKYYVIHQNQTYGPFDKVSSLTSTSQGLAWIGMDGDDYFVVVDGKKWRSYDSIIHSKIYTKGDKIIYGAISTIKRNRVMKPKYYFAINNKAIEYGNINQIQRAIDKHFDPYLDNLYRQDNPAKVFDNMLEIAGKEYRLRKNETLQSNHIILPDSNLPDGEQFYILQVGDDYYWSTNYNNRTTFHLNGNVIGQYDTIGSIKIINGRFVFSAIRDRKAGLVINGHEMIDYELPEFQSTLYSGNNLYEPLNFNGRIVFKAYENGAYFIIEEQGIKPATHSDKIIRVVLSSKL